MRTQNSGHHWEDLGLKNIERIQDPLKVLLEGCRTHKSDSTLYRGVRTQNRVTCDNPKGSYPEESGFSENQGTRAPFSVKSQDPVSYENNKTVVFRYCLPYCVSIQLVTQSVSITFFKAQSIHQMEIISETLF